MPCWLWPYRADSHSSTDPADCNYWSRLACRWGRPEIGTSCCDWRSPRGSHWPVSSPLTHWTSTAWYTYLEEKYSITHCSMSCLRHFSLINFKGATHHVNSCYWYGKLALSLKPQKLMIVLDSNFMNMEHVESISYLIMENNETMCHNTNLYVFFALHLLHLLCKTCTERY